MAEKPNYLGIGGSGQGGQHGVPIASTPEPAGRESEQEEELAWSANDGARLESVVGTLLAWYPKYGPQTVQRLRAIIGARLPTELERTKADLRKYGRHLQGCAPAATSARAKCDCGFDKALVGSPDNV